MCNSFYSDSCKKLTPVFAVHSIQLISVLLTRSQEGGGRRRGGGVLEGRQLRLVFFFYLACNIRAIIPAANGAAAEVPVCLSVHPVPVPRRQSVVTCKNNIKDMNETRI